jgi:phosphoribosyl 1,2-cyclic phosphate phosphodiesterase
MGRRVWEMNFDWERWPPQHRVTNIYLPQRVAVDFKERLGMWEHLSYLQQLGVVRLLVLGDGETVVVGDTQVYPFRLAVDYVYGFLLVRGDTRVFIAPDELFGWEPPELVRGVDVAVIPKGIQEFNPFTGERQIPAEHPVLKSEATFRQTLQMVRRLQAREVVMTHIEEADRLSYEDLLRLEEQLRQEGFNIRFAYDTMVLELPLSQRSSGSI